MRGVSVFFVVFNFHYKLDLIREPAFFIGCFILFPSLALFVSS